MVLLVLVVLRAAAAVLLLRPVVVLGDHSVLRQGDLLLLVVEGLLLHPLVERIAERAGWRRRR